MAALPPVQSAVMTIQLNQLDPDWN